MTAAIEIDAIHKRYGATQALRGVSFSIARGEFFGLLGPNGAGKSTLINILAGLTRATSGTARVAGHDVVKDFARTWRWWRCFWPRSAPWPWRWWRAATKSAIDPLRNL